MRLTSSIALLALWLCSAVALPACGDSGGYLPYDTWTDADTSGRGTVEILEDDPLVVRYRETVVVTGTYRGPGGSPGAAELTVALAGTAHDTSLSDTAVSASTSGSFAVELTAGSVDAQFGLRVTAHDGAEDEIQVRVQAPAGVDLDVDADYAGRRRVDLYRVLVQTGAETCPDLAAEDVLDVYTDDATVPVVVEALPSTVELAVSLWGLYCDAETTLPEECLAWTSGCETSVVLEAGEPAELAVTLTDDMTVFAGSSMDVSMHVSTAGAASGWVGSLLAPLSAMVDDAPDPAAFLVDGVYEVVATEIGTSQADLFLGANYAGELDAAVSAVLTADLGSDVEALHLALIAEMASVDLAGTLEGDFWGEMDQPAVLSLEQVGGVTEVLDASSVLAADPAAAEIRVLYALDEVAFSEHTLPVGLGEVALGLMQTAVLPEMPGPGSDGVPLTLREYLTERVDCAAVGGALAADPDAGSIADAAWYTGACGSVLAELDAAVGEAAGSLDTTHPGLTLTAGCDFLASDGSARAPMACQGSLSGVSWGEDGLEGDHQLVMIPEVAD